MHGTDSLVWGIVLAGGNGLRLQQFTRRLFGEVRPKQYCSFTGSRSMLTQTLDRVRKIVHPPRIVTIVNRDHLRYLTGSMPEPSMGNIVVQPANRDTAPGILLPLLKIYRRNPAAIVAIFPSDHFIRNESRFRSYVNAAVSFIHRNPEFLIILGSRPDRPDQSYGWIQKGELLEGRRNVMLYRVHAFYEKPAAERASELHTAGCLWNTMIMVGTAEALLRKFRDCTPGLFGEFNRIQSSLNSPREADAVETIFTSLPSINFSGAILERFGENLGVIPMDGVYWSDWGEERRIIADCRRFGMALHHSGGTDHESARQVGRTLGGLRNILECG